jgi:hypothetical protein
MRIQDQKTVGVLCAIGVLSVLAAMPMVAQTTGVSHPPTAPIVDTDDLPATVPAAKPSPAVPMPATPATGAAAGSVIPAAPGQTYGAYVPYTGPGAAAAAPAQATAGPAFDPDANIVTEATAGRRVIKPADPNDPDAGIVTRVVSPAGAVREGAVIKARLRETLSTETTQPGAEFSAVLSAPVMREGEVIAPAGSVLEGRVTYVRSGTRFNGGAAIHLEPRSITLPDGSAYVVRARVIDTQDWDKTKVDDEGTIEHRNDAKKAAAAIGLSTGGGAAAGAMMGGPVGAVVGAGVGAGAATVVWLKQDTQAELPKDLELTFSLTEPMSVTPLGAGHASAEKKADVGGE